MTAVSSAVTCLLCTSITVFADKRITRSSMHYMQLNLHLQHVLRWYVHVIHSVHSAGAI